MFVLGVVGSPRKNGTSNRLVDSVLEGVRSRGITTKKVYLMDYEIKPFSGEGGASEAFKCCPEELSRLCEEANAIVLGAPVYWGDINSLTKSFLDTVRISNCSGKLAIGTAIAGGTGKGCTSGVQTIYHFFFHRQMIGIDPTPVTRFNLQDALKQLQRSGVKLIDLLADGFQPLGKPKEDPNRIFLYESRWPDVLAHYASLEYLNYDPLDEIVLLAKQLLLISEESKVEEAKLEFNKAVKLIGEGRRRDAARYAARSYQLLYSSSRGRL